MNKINKKIILSSGILAILAFGVIIMPLKTNADRAGYVTPYGATRFNNNISGNNQYNTYQEPNNLTPIYYSLTSTPIVYSNSANPNAVKTAPKTVVAKTETVIPINTSPVIAPVPITVAKTTTSEKSNLAANAVFGSNSFMPSGLVQWIFFAILILLIVILVRKIYGGSEKYHATPMKHD